MTAYGSRMATSASDHGTRRAGRSGLNRVRDRSVSSVCSAPPCIAWANGLACASGGVAVYPQWGQVLAWPKGELSWVTICPHWGHVVASWSALTGILLGRGAHCTPTR